MKLVTLFRRTAVAVALAGFALVLVAQVGSSAQAQSPDDDECDYGYCVRLGDPGSGGHGGRGCADVEAWLEPVRGRSNVFQLCAQAFRRGTVSFDTANEYRNRGRDCDLGVRLSLRAGEANFNTTVTLERGDRHITPLLNVVPGDPIILG